MRTQAINLRLVRHGHTCNLPSILQSQLCNLSCFKNTLMLSIAYITQSDSSEKITNDKRKNSSRLTSLKFQAHEKQTKGLTWLTWRKIFFVKTPVFLIWL